MPTGEEMVLAYVPGCQLFTVSRSLQQAFRYGKVSSLFGSGDERLGLDSGICFKRNSRPPVAFCCSLGGVMEGLSDVTLVETAASLECHT